VNVSDPIRRVSVVSTGQVQIRPEHVASNWRPTLWWLLASRLIEAGQLTPVIGKTYPLHQAPDAMRHLQAGDARGKLVLTTTGAR